MLIGECLFSDENYEDAMLQKYDSAGEYCTLIAFLWHSELQIWLNDDIKGFKPDKATK